MPGLKRRVFVKRGSMLPAAAAWMGMIAVSVGLMQATCMTPPAPTPTPTSGALTAADNGSSVQIRVGDMLQVSLAENSTTGYEWETEAVDSSILLYVDEQFQLDPYCGDRVGCGGTITLRFEAAGTGLTILRIVYRRTEEMGFVSDGPAVDTFEATVQVVP